MLVLELLAYLVKRAPTAPLHNLSTAVLFSSVIIVRLQIIELQCVRQ